MARYYKKKIIRTSLAGRLTYLAIRAHCRTLKISVVNEASWQELHRAGERVLLCTWHQHLFGIMVGRFWNYCDWHPAVMISRSADGDLVSCMARLAGWRPVRGSSSRGGMAALKTMIRHMRTHRMGVHILDGPRGPRGKVKPGVIQLARAAKAVLVPFYLTTDRAWVFNSWDRFFIPKPGARATVRFGEPLRIKPVKDKADLEAERLRLQELMLPGLRNP